jgi:predicted Zn-dependent protease with MMP-like domain
VSRLENVHVVVEDEPSPEQLRGLDRGSTLFGLYQGIPQTSRGAGYTFVAPDRITIFRGPITRAYRGDAEIRRQVARTVVHELAHHFGISDDRLEELGW